MRRFALVCAVLFNLVFVSSCLPAPQAGKSTEVSTPKVGDLTQPTSVSLSVRDQPLPMALTAFEKGTGTPIEVDSVFPSEAEILSQSIRIDLQDRPFWETVAALCRSADLKVNRISRRRIVLEPQSRIGDPTRVPAGDPITAGAFFVFPTYDTTLNELFLDIRPEPRAAWTSLVNYDARLRFSDGTSASYQPKFLIWVYDLVGECHLRVDKKTLGDHKQIEQVDLKAELEVPTRWEEVTLPPLGTLLPKSVAVAGGRLHIERFGLEEKPDPEHNEIGLYLRTTKLPAGDEQGLEQFALVGPDQSRIPAFKVGRSSFEKEGVPTQSFDVGFPPQDLKEPPDSYRLAIRFNDGGETIIGPIRDIAPRRVAAGLAQVNVAQADLKNGEVTILIDNVRIPNDRVRLDVGHGQPLEPYGYSVSSGSPQELGFTFPVDDVTSKPATWKLVLQAPTASISYTLQTTLHDLQLTE